MSPNFDQQSPLVQSIFIILRQSPEGLAIPEIRRKLLLQGRLGVQESDIETIVRLPEFKRLPGGRIVLEELRTPTVVNEDFDEVTKPDQAFEKHPSTLRRFPRLNSYIIFDTETNGLDPTSADFFQLSAIKIIDGKPVEIFDRFAQIEEGSISRALQVKLHFDELRLAKKIRFAQHQSIVVQEFGEFCQGLPVLAHNGTFDIGFIRKHAPDFPNTLIDTLELLILAFPTFSSHTIENLAELRGYTRNGKKWSDVEILDRELGISKNLAVDQQELFHSAIYDCLILFLLFRDAVESLQILSPAFKVQLRVLSMNLGDLIMAPMSEDIAKPKQISDLISLNYWQSSIDHNRTLLTDRPVFDVTTTHEQYQRLLDKLYLEPRSSQVEMLRQVTDTLLNNSKTMIEAPTGTGKTFAYLIPAIQLAKSTGRQVVISTSTKTLQDQIVRDLETKIKPNSPNEFQYAVLKGQENYLCLGRLWDVIEETFYGENIGESSFEEKLSLLYLLRFAAETQNGDLQSTSYWFQQRFPILAYLKSSLCSRSETCNPSSPCYSYCYYSHARALAEQAELLIINHTLLLMRRWADDQTKYLILDEAHNLEDVATSAYTEEVSRNIIEQWLNRLLRVDGKRGVLILTRKFLREQETVTQALGCVRRMHSRVAEFGGYLKEFIERTGGMFNAKYGVTWRMRASPKKTHYFAWQYVEQIQNEIIRELETLQRLTNSLYHQLANYQGADVNRATSLAKELQAIQSNLFGTPDEPGQKILLEEIPQVGYDPLVIVHWIELSIRGQIEGQTISPEKINWSLRRAPVRVGNLLQEKVYKRVQALVLTSATLSLAEGGFNFFLDRLGLMDQIPPERLSRLSNVFDYEEQVMLGMPGYFKSSARYDEVDAFQKEISRELQCFFRFTEGRGLVLHTARSRMEYVAQSLEKSLSNLPIYWQKQGASTHILQEEFSKREESILLGVRSFWEGIDVPGPSLSYLVIDKLPFPVPTEPIIESRRDQLRADGGNEWMDYLIPLAALHFKQGFGRLMRRSNDRGVVLFLDKRLRSDTFYREAVLGSLPGYKRTDEMIEAEESRATFYQEIARHMEPVFPDLQSRIDIFPCIREEVIPDVERLFRELELPIRIAKEDFVAYRSNLIRAAQELIQGFLDFKEEQDDAMRSILSGYDTLVVLPTGSGKSLTFQLPALLRNGVTLVFSPLIALMRDQVDKLKTKGLTLVDYIVSGQSGAHRDDVYRRMMNGNLRLVYIAPERVRDPALAEAVKNANVIQVVVDEAHCVHMWGNSFRPDFLNIPNLFDEEHPPIVALTATATSETRIAIINALKFDNEYCLVTRTVNRPELKFIVYNENSAPEQIASKQDKQRVLIKILTAARKQDEVALVYTSTVREAEQLSRILNLNGFSVRFYHGKMQTQAREEVQELFREGIVKIIVATKAFGMGIDKSDVRYVIHYDIPGDLESYFQEAGRAGRDGKDAYCILLYHKSDLSTQQYFIRSAFPEEAELNSLLQSLRGYSIPGEKILIRPDDLANDAGIDVERLDITLHLLERMGFVHRSFNFTLTANVLLNRSSSWISSRLPDEKRKIFDLLVSFTRISNKLGIQLDLLLAANQSGLDPISIDLFFTEISAKGWAVYRPWDRGYTLEPLEKMFEGDIVQLEKADVEKFRRTMSKNLKRMMRYAESLGAGDCRRKFILEHFGEVLKQKVDVCCNLCNREVAYPWSGITTSELAGLSSEIDPSYVVLRAVEWNDSLYRNRNLSPYTQKTLSYVLMGNGFAATQRILDPVKKLRRLKRLESSPYYGILQGIRGGLNRVSKIFGRLEHGDYIYFEIIAFKGAEGEDIEYKAPALTLRGRQQIQLGKFIEE